MAISYVSIHTHLGELLLAATERGICFIQVAGHEQDALAHLGKVYPDAELSPAAGDNKTRLLEWGAAINRYVDGNSDLPELPLDMQGTEFQRKVWEHLRKIPAGRPQSYKEVANALGMPKAVRAVANACASNPIALIVPCHRVVRSDGGLSGYRWGIKIKQALIEMEKTCSALWLSAAC
jgi:AraC family transcriptional regulator, regulatory protein of adaptative response / methylated-DNA-[protein]-cysteine methyltransferase